MRVRCLLMLGDSCRAVELSLISKCHRQSATSPNGANRRADDLAALYSETLNDPASADTSDTSCRSRASPAITSSRSKAEAMDRKPQEPTDHPEYVEQERCLPGQR